MSNFDLRKFLTENKLTTNSKLLNEGSSNDSYSDYKPGMIAPADLYYSDKHGKLVAMGDVDDKYHDSLKDYLVVRKGEKIPDPMDEELQKVTENNIQKALNSLEVDVDPNGEAFLEKHGITTREQAIELLKALRSEYNDWAYTDIAKAIKMKFGGTSPDAADLAIGGKNYSVGEDDPNDDGTITSIEKYPNGYFITGTVHNQDGEEKEGYGYAIDLDGNEMDEEDLQGRD
jgi:hypothetical protein